jgi:hypothetical protein
VKICSIFPITPLKHFTRICLSDMRTASDRSFQVLLGQACRNLYDWAVQRTWIAIRTWKSQTMSRDFFITEFLDDESIYDSIANSKRRIEGLKFEGLDHWLLLSEPTVIVSSQWALHWGRDNIMISESCRRGLSILMLISSGNCLYRKILAISWVRKKRGNSKW